ncbi:MAG: S-methyl-5'-thioadenosine phosphorylase [Nitrospirae bacterium CG18_big_fil_WC_8_21_14_2_50_70_55]|nr:S-methyl-5'-thioadenosine phosphorylase [Deltaproteobacteria bacterium]OIP66071.1 MAG: methylthioadenosine phosphorylase [Nitrospirae bacterium CG2_30_70_394]PIQ04383.1 MAG: S-methyl-5'-thioadenosine phosphorylase [Nitrospirae bacterium CG18_big_fil_WC_8_21_14_2_50_70_55]PIU79022.1 MAG: S-methyl-5'-thioadenosine phosphorylase [Nitrospirae bacterium CG06_land_8_20_14_3_00_70_43]PIW83086.1 MAG: S-methyl-5'-thioadenosine phosphorylase [Nitrospirae bacterium CG_4_8_14_3_um_filter_70_85]PIX82234
MIGVIGGSGLYQLEELEGASWERVATPYGAASDDLLCGRLHGIDVCFLPRHGRNHRLLPSEINYRANLCALKQIGVRRVVSISAVGSLKEEIVPGHMVVVSQFVDRSLGRTATFFGDGVVGHVSMADPVCPDLARRLAVAARGAGATCHENATYLGMAGPQFSSRAESNLYRSWGMDVIGMTNATEAKLAREAGLCYATLAMATDYDCWRVAEEAVAAADVLATLQANVAVARALLLELIQGDVEARPCACARAASAALLTPKESIPPARLAALAVVLEP